MHEEQLKHSRILIVDDQVANICLLQNILNRIGFSQVKGVMDSRQAMEVISEYKPDIIVLDLNMPHISGYDILQQMTPLMARDFLPVLVLTADATSSAKRRALACGATDLLHKPFDSSEAIMRIRSLLRTRFLNLEVQNQNALLEQKVDERTRELTAALEELKQTQQQVLQQERLRAFGEMAGGVVHDFNNTLMSIIGYSDLLLSDQEMMRNPGIVEEYLRTINTAGRDASHVVSRLRDFYRPRHLADVFMPTDLNKLLEQAMHLTQPKWKDQALSSGRTITIDLEFRKLPFVNINEAEFRELTTNLIFNAVDAMPNGGTITLRTYSTQETVIFELQDTGTGMTEEVKTRCLEPFFSTKEEKGTGLGLSMVFGIVQRHGGLLEIDSAVGRGTTFRIRLPLAGVDSVSEQTEEPPLGRTLRILVVDDEPAPRDVVSKYLRADGHEVVTAANGSEAVARFQQGAYDLMVTDNAMPGMSGVQLASIIREMQQKQPIIMLTGFSDSALQNRDRTESIDRIIHKPVPHLELRRVIAETLAEISIGRPGFTPALAVAS